MFQISFFLFLFDISPGLTHGNCFVCDFSPVQQRTVVIQIVVSGWLYKTWEGNHVESV